MVQQTFTISGKAVVQIRNSHDRISVAGWDNTQTLSTDSPAKQEGDTLVIEDAERVWVRMPRSGDLVLTDCDADVRIEDLTGRVELADIEGDVVLHNLRGETLVRGLEGNLVAREVTALTGEKEWEGDAALRSVERAQVEEIDGDLSLSDTNEATLRFIGGDLEVRGTHKTLSVGDARGDANLRSVEGKIHLDQVAGDLFASDVRGEFEARDVEGDAIVSLTTVQGLRLRADGDVVLHLPTQANAAIELDAPRGRVVARAEINVTQRDGDHLVGTIGTGGAKIEVESVRGDVVVRAGAAGPRPEEAETFRLHFAGMGQRIAEDVRRSVEESMKGTPWSKPGHWDWIFGHERRKGHEHKHHKHWKGFAGSPFVSEEPPPAEGAPTAEETPPMEAREPRGPAAGSPERKAILDAIARGELSVDEAIRKLTGEEK